MEKKSMPKGYQEFMARLKANARDQGTDHANTDCEICRQRILLVGPGWVSMHVFVYPDAPHYTTKALCLNCCNVEMAKHGGRKVSEVLN